MRPHYREELTHDLRQKPDVQTGIRFALLDMLYDEKITIKEFQAYCLDSGLDYNAVEHCCGCAGCVKLVEGSPCPDFDNPNCQIVDREVYN